MVKQTDFTLLQASNFLHFQSIKEEKDVMISFKGLLVAGDPHFI